jgi:hypothetical protein
VFRPLCGSGSSITTTRRRLKKFVVLFCFPELAISLPIVFVSVVDAKDDDNPANVCLDAFTPS